MHARLPARSKATPADRAARWDRGSVSGRWQSQLMHLVDVVDALFDGLPKKLARLLLVGLLVFSGGKFMTWYIVEKAASVNEIMQGVLDQMIEDPTPRPPVTVSPPKPA